MYTFQKLIRLTPKQLKRHNTGNRLKLSLLHTWVKLPRLCEYLKLFLLKNILYNYSNKFDFTLFLDSLKHSFETTIHMKNSTIIVINIIKNISRLLKTCFLFKVVKHSKCDF